MSPLKKEKDKIFLHIKAIPNAKKAGIAEIREGRLVVKITAPPDKGRANKALIEFLADELKIRKSVIVLESGDTARNKTVSFPVGYEPVLESFLAPYL